MALCRRSHRKGDGCMEELVTRKAALEALEQIYDELWGIDIPSATVPEYIEHHRDVQLVMKKVDLLREKIEKMHEPLVRCGECKFFRPAYDDSAWCTRERDYYPVLENDFCSLGKKK